MVLKILVCGEYYSTNLGDPIIVDSLIHGLRTLYPKDKVEVMDLNGRLSRDVGNHIISKKRKFKRPMFLKSLKNFTHWHLFDNRSLTKFYKEKMDNADIIIFAGGQLLMNNNLLFPLRLNAIVTEANKQGIPIIFNSCGVQNYKKWNYGRLLLRKVLNQENVKVITTRDDLEMLKKYVNPTQKVVEKTIDSAVWCEDTYSIKKDDKSSVVGLGIIAPVMYLNYYERTKDKSYFSTEEDLIEFWLELIKKLDENGIEWKIFTNGELKDFEFGKKILRLLNYEKFHNYIVRKPLTPEELVGDISGFKAIISQRLHSHIISYSLKIPSVGLIWDKKALDFAEVSGRKEFFYSINSSTVDEIYYKLVEVLKDEEDTNLDKLKEKALKNVKRINDFIS